MTPNPVHLDKIKTTLLSLLIATAGGLTAWLIDLPIPFLLGSTIAVTAASLSGIRIYIPDRLRGFVFFSLGIQAGSGVSPGILDQMVLWPVSFLMLFVALVLVTSLTYLMLRKGFGWDGPTALFSALPGALSFVLVAAMGTSANMVKITVIQCVRLLLLIGFLAPLLAVIARNAPHVVVAVNYDWTIQEAIILLVCGGAGALLGYYSRIPGGMMLGALLASGILHATSIVTAVVPRSIADLGLIVLGVLIGSRVGAEHRTQLVRYLPAALLAFLIGTAASFAAALVVWLLLDIHPAQIALAFAPGALEALTVIAFSLGVDPSYVASHHVVRFLMIAFSVPFLARFVAR
ncbi:AbrB family transcriptional regulator [Phyllobacterium pellucidum]|uniref:AbrB family transcriptional regulator n=1 Tax=Phyllobacterium pellucidum TaxID=2740464 RepID=UPI001D134E06|nr:AbrB family transcriptional regulator [Phyllobacterium sp. T1018]UGY10691.1 AbrB family transcriptional regulator [Phyllobacterium sp. T1018]